MYQARLAGLGVVMGVFRGLSAGHFGAVRKDCHLYAVEVDRIARHWMCQVAERRACRLLKMFNRDVQIIQYSMIEVNSDLHLTSPLFHQLPAGYRAPRARFP